MPNNQQITNLLTTEEYYRLINTGVYIGSTKVKGVNTSLFLTKGSLWVEVYYENNGENIAFVGLCPEHRLPLYVEGHV